MPVQQELDPVALDLRHDLAGYEAVRARLGDDGEAIIGRQYLLD